MCNVYHKTTYFPNVFSGLLYIYVLHLSNIFLCLNLILFIYINIFKFYIENKWNYSASDPMNTSFKIFENIQICGISKAKRTIMH